MPETGFDRASGNMFPADTLAQHCFQWGNIDLMSNHTPTETTAQPDNKIQKGKA